MFYDPAHSLSWRIIYIRLERKIVVLILNKVFYKCPLHQLSLCFYKNQILHTWSLMVLSVEIHYHTNVVVARYGKTWKCSTFLKSPIFICCNLRVFNIFVDTTDGQNWKYRVYKIWEVWNYAIHIFMELSSFQLVLQISLCPFLCLYMCVLVLEIFNVISILLNFTWTI